MEHQQTTTSQATDHPENRLRKWAAPLTIGFFALTAFTGMLLFLEVHLGLLKPVHEWASIFLVLTCALHISVNWRSTRRYFGQTHTRLILAGIAMLMAVSLLPIAEDGHEGHREDQGQIFPSPQADGWHDGDRQNRHAHH